MAGRNPFEFDSTLFARVCGLVLVAGAVLTAGAARADECAAARSAHERFLASSFEVGRTLRMSVNGDIKKREVAHLTYSAGKLETDVLEDQVLSKTMVFESEGKDIALEFEFDCARLESLGKGRYELTSEDGIEVMAFDLDEETGAWVPVSWRLDTTERFLFKKFVMEGRVEYSDFAWR